MMANLCCLSAFWLAIERTLNTPSSFYFTYTKTTAYSVCNAVGPLLLRKTREPVDDVSTKMGGRVSNLSA